MCQSFFHDGWATPLDPFFLAAPSSAAGWQPRRSCVSAFPCGSCRWAFPQPALSYAASLFVACQLTLIIKSGSTQASLRGC